MNQYRMNYYDGIGYKKESMTSKHSFQAEAVQAISRLGIAWEPLSAQSCCTLEEGHAQTL